MLNLHYGWSEYFGAPQHISLLRQMVQDNLLLALLIYMTSTVIACVVLALPGLVFAILAGALFGPWLGTLTCCVTATIGAGLAFTAGRFFLKESLKPIVMKNVYIRQFLFDDVEKNDMKLLMITRLIPLFPYNLQNFAYGITDISFRKYILYSFIFMLPGTAMYTIGTAGILNAEHRYQYLGLAMVIAIAVVTRGQLKKKQITNTQERSVSNDFVVAERDCVSCGICRENCSFLEKYLLDFSKEEALSKLAGHCFLCGKCTAVCPHGVDGRKHILDMRRKNTAKSQVTQPTNFFMQFEKTNYLFKNYKYANKKSVLFPGCSYPSLYPETTKELIEILSQNGIGVVFDCCGKPIGETGQIKKEEAILTRLNQKLIKQGVEEIVTICPNCYEYLSGKLEVRVISIYEKLITLGIGNRVSETGIHVFPPCPDRYEKKWIKQMHPFLPAQTKLLESIQCCGLGGCAFQHEKQIVSEWSCKLSHELTAEHTEQFYVYCASCAGAFTRNKVGQVRHLLNEILGSFEEVDVRHSLLNRIKFKWY